jgi:predicted AAA+ superfamily ATPase
LQDEAGVLNAAQLARGIGVSGSTVAHYLDLLVDLLLVRRLPPWHRNVGKRLVKSPKVYIRDSGLVHALLGLATKDELLGHPIVGGSWEGYVIETLLGVAPPGTEASFYRTVAGAEMDLVLALPGGPVWTIEVKRGVAPKLERGFHTAIADLAPEKTFVVYNGLERFPLNDHTDAIGLVELARVLQAVRG